MSILAKLKTFVRSMDLFAQPVTFRYAGAPNYESLTGGVASIILILLFVGIFATTVIATLKK